MFCHGLGELFRQDNPKAQELGIQLSSDLLSASSEAETVGQFFAFFLACLENKTNGAGGTQYIDLTDELGVAGMGL